MKLTKIKKAMDKLINQVGFVGGLARICLGKASKDQRKFLEEIFCFRCDVMVDSFNEWMQRTIDALNEGKISIDGLSFQHVECLSELFDSKDLDKRLQEELKKLLEKKCNEVIDIRKKQSQMFGSEDKIKSILSGS